MGGDADCGHTRQSRPPNVSHTDFLETNVCRVELLERGLFSSKRTTEFKTSRLRFLTMPFLPLTFFAHVLVCYPRGSTGVLFMLSVTSHPSLFTITSFILIPPIDSLCFSHVHSHFNSRVKQVTISSEVVWGSWVTNGVTNSPRLSDV
jgi:hypothetical protein